MALEMGAEGQSAMRIKMNKNGDNHALTVHKPAPDEADSRIVARKKRTKTTRLGRASSKKLIGEDARILSALDKMKKSSGIKAHSVTDRLLCQTASATLRHWGTKESTPGERLELAASALAEMEPSNSTEAMLANQMIAANDAALLFVHQATLNETTSQQRDDNTDRACKFLALFIEQVDAMQRLKGKAGRQKVTVEHVNVHAGGQAIVGTVTARRPGEGVGDSAGKSGNTP
jgi:hypothetical protein